MIGPPHLGLSQTEQKLKIHLWNSMAVAGKSQGCPLNLLWDVCQEQGFPHRQPLSHSRVPLWILKGQGWDVEVRGRGRAERIGSEDHGNRKTSISFWKPRASSQPPLLSACSSGNF